MRSVGLPNDSPAFDSTNRMGLSPKPPSHGGYNKFNYFFLSNAAASRCRLSCQVLDHDVSCAVSVPVRLIGAEGAAEMFLASQVGVESTTMTACLAGIGLVAYDHIAVVVGAGLLQEVLPEAKVAHGAHGTSRLAPNLALHLHEGATGATLAEGDLLDHLLCLKLGQQDHTVVVAQPMKQSRSQLRRASLKMSHNSSVCKFYGRPTILVSVNFMGVPQF